MYLKTVRVDNESKFDVRPTLNFFEQRVDDVLCQAILTHVMSAK